MTASLPHVFVRRGIQPPRCFRKCVLRNPRPSHLLLDKSKNSTYSILLAITAVPGYNVGMSRGNPRKIKHQIVHEAVTSLPGTRSPPLFKNCATDEEKMRRLGDAFADTCTWLIESDARLASIERRLVALERALHIDKKVAVR